jgi:quinol monooxygenase YgiN
MKLKNVLIAGFLAVAAISAASAVQAADARLFVRHEVADYGTWRKAFDAFAPTQKKMGVIYSAVYRSSDNTNDVTVIHDFHSVAKAKAFVASPELQAAMEKAGVKGVPQIWIATKGAK